jgi:hypothetical protein
MAVEVAKFRRWEHCSTNLPSRHPYPSRLCLKFLGNCASPLEDRLQSSYQGAHGRILELTVRRKSRLRRFHVGRVGTLAMAVRLQIRLQEFHIGQTEET